MAKQLRIAMFSVHACPLASEEGKETGGLNIYVLELAKELGNLGHKVDIFTRREKRSNPAVVKVSKNVRVVHLKTGPERPVSKKTLIKHLDEFVVNFHIFKHGQNIKYDVLHCHYYLSGLAGIKCKDKCCQNATLVMTFHTLALMKNLVARSNSERSLQTRITAEFRLMQKADAITASSESDADYITHLYGANPNKLTAVPPGVDLNIFKSMNSLRVRKSLNINPNNQLILAVGRIEPLKGFDAILYALKILIQKSPKLEKQLCLYIIGGDLNQKQMHWTHEQKKLETLRKQLSLTTQVEFVNQQPQKQLAKYYNAANVVVMPSHYESFGMVALEAMACGTPVIASNVAGISRFIHGSKRGLITTANNPMLLAEQIGKTLQSKTLNKEPNLPKTFSWEAVASAMEDIYLR